MSSVEKEEGKKKKFVCQESSFRRKRKRDTERRGHMVVLADPNPRQAKSADSVMGRQSDGPSPIKLESARDVTES